MGLQADYGISIKLNGSDISDHVISYNWTKKVCTGIGTLTLEVENSIFTDIGISDVITIYEDSTLAFTGYVQRNSNDYNNGIALVECQDKSKFLIDYFIAESYLVDYASYSRTWIEQFLTEAQISYNFLTEENGTLISNNTSLGMMSAYDQVMNLLQQSGWYIEFGASGTASIGKLTAQISGSVSINKSRIIGVELLRDDKMLRNRAVVWGNANPLTGTQVYADVYRPTNWDIDSYDRRAFLIANSNIPNIYSAYVLANVGLDEFTKITEEKHITVESLLDVSFSSRVYVTSDVFNGSGIVTTYGTSMGEGGLVTNIILDERCPRLFGSFYDFGDYVYVGTDGAGIKRKQLESGTWYDYSTGINDLHISDLYKKKDLLVCVTVSGEAYRAYGGDAGWTQLNIPPLESDLGVISSGLMPRACILDKTTNNIRLLVDNTDRGNDLYEYDIHVDYITAATSGAGSRAWVLDYTANGYFLNSYQVITEGSESMYAGGDIENDGSNDYVSVETTIVAAYDYVIEEEMGQHTGGANPDNRDSITSFSETFPYGIPTTLGTFSDTYGKDEISTSDTINLKRANYTIGTSAYPTTVRVTTIVDNSPVTKTFTLPSTITSLSNRSLFVSTFISDTVSRFYFVSRASISNIIISLWYVDCNVDTLEVTYGQITLPSTNMLLKFAFDGYYYFRDWVDTGTTATFYIYKMELVTGEISTYYSFSRTDSTGEAGLGSVNYRFSGTPEIVINNGVIYPFCPYLKGEWTSPGTWVDLPFPFGAWYVEPRADITIYNMGTETGTYMGEGGWHKDDTAIYTASVNQYNRTQFSSYGSIAYIGDPWVAETRWGQQLFWTQDGMTLGDIWWYGEVSPTFPTTLASRYIFDDNSTRIGNNGFGHNYRLSEYGVPEAAEMTINDANYVLVDIFPTVDSNTGSIYAVARYNSTEIRLVRLSAEGDVELYITIKSYLSTSTNPYASYLSGKWFGVNTIGIGYINKSISGEYTNPYGLILKRNGADFEIIKEGQGSPPRLELSSSNPLMRHNSRNFYNLKLYDTGLEEWVDMSAGSVNYKDGCFDAKYCYRQEDLESDSHFTILYTTAPLGVYSPTFEGVKKIDLDAFYNQEEGNTEDFSQLLGDGTEFITMSGVRWVETTNYKYPYQYIFVANSGLPCKFYQQNDGNLTINDYSSGLPASSPITIIRVDDEL